LPRPQPDGTTKLPIYRDLRRSIILGHRQPGDRLDLNTLADSYGTSVTPVRDALQMLSQERLVTIRPRSGYYVTRITLKQLQDMLELREILEVASVERATMRITDEQLAELERVHAGYTGDDDESRERYASENRYFHYLLARASGNQELAEMLGRLHDRLVRFIILCGNDDTLETWHGRLIDALRTRDVEIARKAMLAELSESRKNTLEHVIEEEGAFWRLGTRSEQVPVRRS
jgi:DNA-binding GntR family transcriptional regulator